MTKIVNAKKKVSRQLGVNLWGRANSPFEKRNYKPGEHGFGSRPRISGYGVQLRAKQRLRKYYNIIEKQFKSIFKKAKNQKGDTSENFVGLLESRLDTVVYRANFVPTVFAARQFVNHKHVLVNGKTVNIPSYVLKPGDVVEVKEKSRQLPMVLEATQNMERDIPVYLELDSKNMKVKYLNVPMLADIPYPFDPSVNLIVEFYSK